MSGGRLALVIPHNIRSLFLRGGQGSIMIKKPSSSQTAGCKNLTLTRMYCVFCPAYSFWVPGSPSLKEGAQNQGCAGAILPLPMRGHCMHLFPAPHLMIQYRYLETGHSGGICIMETGRKYKAELSSCLYVYM